MFKLINAGKHKDALSLAERALATRLEILGAKHAHTATAQNNLGAVYHGLGEYQKALKYFEQAFASWRSALGDRHADVATAANNVGFLAYQLGDYARARRYLDFAHVIPERVAYSNPKRLILSAIAGTASRP